MAALVMERSGEMEVFARVVRDGGFSAAGRSLGLTPSAVSKLVARLEARLGTRLLTRSTRVVALTEEGDAYFQAAQRVLKALDDAEYATTTGAARGHLSITSSVPVGTLFVAPALSGFLQQHPELTVELGFTDDIVNLITQKADVAIRVGDLADSSLMARKLAASRRVVVASPAYLRRRGTPKTPDALEHHDCLRFSFHRPGRGWPFVRGGQGFEQAIAGSLLVNNGETMKQMVLAGAGIARLGRFHVAREIARGELVELLAAFNPGDLESINAVYVGGEHVPARIRAFVGHMAAWFAQHFPAEAKRKAK